MSECSIATSIHHHSCLPAATSSSWLSRLISRSMSLSLLLHLRLALGLSFAMMIS